MICSYGDKFDVDAINRKKLESKIIFDEKGKLNELAGKYKGLGIKQAREKILDEQEIYNLAKKKVNSSNIRTVGDFFSKDRENRRNSVFVLEKKRKERKSPGTYNIFKNSEKKTNQV